MGQREYYLINTAPLLFINKDILTLLIISIHSDILTYIKKRTNEIFG